MAISASSVSRALRSGGLLTVPMNGPRDGLSVAKTHRADLVHVQASIVDDGRAESALILRARNILEQKGYVAQLRINSDGCHLDVTRDEPLRGAETT